MSDDDADNPKRKVQAAVAVTLPKRFYTDVAVAASDAGFAVHLDGRPIRTPGKRPLAVGVRAVADAMAEEWSRQWTHIDPSTMPLTRLVNTALDAVAGREDAVRDDIVKYAGSDLVCYRAAHPASLVARQLSGWDPLLHWARETLGADFQVSTGIIHVAQPAATLDRIGAAVAPLPALTLAALHSATTLTGSAVLALATLAGRLTAAEAWDLAHIDEDFQIERWGEDAEARAARVRRWSEMQAAAIVLTATTET